MRFISFFLLLFLPILIFAKDDDITSIKEDRRKTLLYGIDSEVKELISKLTKEEIDGFDNELLTLLENSYDESTKNVILNYFIKMDKSIGEKEALKILDAIEYEDEYTLNYAQTAIKYLSKIGSKEAKKRVEDIIASEKNEIIISSLKLIGENELINHEDLLLKMLNDEETDDQVYIEVIKTLGGIKSKKSIDDLIEIAADEDEETTVRNAACYSLGEIGDDKAIPTLKKCFGEKGNFLLMRSALEALGKFKIDEMDSILIEGLRDNNWQIRDASAKSLGERQSVVAIEILKYKAESDPEDKIKKSALRALGEIDTEVSKKYLKDFFLNDDNTASYRIIAVDKLIEKDINYIFPYISDYYEEKVKEKRKPVLDAVMKSLSKKESQTIVDFLARILESDNYLYRIYGIRGLKLNNKVDFYREKIEELSKEDENKSVKKNALSALEEE